MKKFLITKINGVFTNREIPVTSNPFVVGAVRILEQENTPTQEQMEAAFAAPLPAPVKPKEISKLSIRRKLRDMGKEEAYDAFLAAMSEQAQKDYSDAQVFYSNDPMFTAHAPVLKQALGLTDEQFNLLVE